MQWPTAKYGIGGGGGGRRKNVYPNNVQYQNQAVYVSHKKIWRCQVLLPLSLLPLSKRKTLYFHESAHWANLIY